MRVVETDQPYALRIVQCERIAEPVRPLCRWRDALELELEPVALFEVMNAPIERQEEFERVFVRSQSAALSLS